LNNLILNKFKERLPSFSIIKLMNAKKKPIPQKGHKINPPLLDEPIA
jgi:hypothetical protein